jgi:starch synthase
MTVIVSHPTGNANTRAVLRALHDGGLFHSFHTTIAFPPNAAYRALLGREISRALGQRTFPEVPWRQTRLHPVREACRQIGCRIGLKALTKHETGWASADKVYRALDASVARDLRKTPEDIKAIYAFEDGALQSFTAADEIGVKKIYDLPIAHWRTVRALLLGEAERNPEWAETVEGIKDSESKLERKDQEILAADRIVVASAFSKESLQSHFRDLSNVTVAPYGCPSTLVGSPSIRAPREPLRIFYAGRLTILKGLPYLIEAVEQLRIPWHLTFAGQKPKSSVPALNRFLNRSNCAWLGVVPHQTLLEAMTRAHVFVFPSIVEGFGMVITEALAAGLPVITTTNTAGPDILSDGVDGFVVPIRDPEAIAERLTRIADDENFRRELASNALSKASALSWRGFEDQIRQIVAEEIAL